MNGLKHGGMLADTVAYERGAWDDINCPELTEKQISDIYLEAVAWANHTMSAMKVA